MSEKKEGTDLFTINLDDFGDEGKVPGVTLLLNPKKMAEAAAKKAAEAEKTRAQQKQASRTPEVSEVELHSETEPIALPSSHQTKASPSTPRPRSPVSLSEFGVAFELNFKKEKDYFRYSEAKGHQKGTLPAWHNELLGNMKLMSSVFSLNQEFQEFDSKSSPYVIDAFGASEGSFVQMVQKSSQEWIVLLSSRSLKAEKDRLLALVKGIKASGEGAAPAGSNDDDSGSIELDFAS